MKNFVLNKSKLFSSLIVFILILSQALFLHHNFITLTDYNNQHSLSFFSIIFLFNLPHHAPILSYSTHVLSIITTLSLLEAIFLLLAFIMLLSNKFIPTMLFLFLQIFNLFFLYIFTYVKLSKISNNFHNTFSFEFPFPYFILFPIFAFSLCIMKKRTKLEDLLKRFFFIFSVLSPFVFIFMFIVVFSRSLLVFKNFGLTNFLLSNKWNPSLNDFGVVHLILSSLFTIFGAILISTPIGIFTAIYIFEFAPKKISQVIQIMVELLAGIPSIIYGFIGIELIIPSINFVFKPVIFTDSNNFSGYSLLAAILVLSIMILPTIVGTSVVAFKNVPTQYITASLGLGATKIQTIFKILVNSAKPELLTGISLATARALGEATAVRMVCGNSANFPKLLYPVKTLTTAITSNLTNASDLHKSALFAVSGILILISITVNLLFFKISKMNKKGNKH